MPKTLGKPLLSGSGIFTGSYTGNGNATQAITGVGFQPKFIIIFHRTVLGLTAGWVFKSNQDGLNASYPILGVIIRTFYESDYIISLDADGFTVGDGTGGTFGNLCNILNTVYTYCCWK